MKSAKFSNGKSRANERGSGGTHTREEIGLVSRVTGLSENCGSVNSNDGDTETSKRKEKSARGRRRPRRDRGERDAPDKLLHDLKPDDEPSSSLEMVRVGRSPEHGGVVVQVVVLGVGERNDAVSEEEETRLSKKVELTCRSISTTSRI